MPQSFWDPLAYTKVSLKSFYFPFCRPFYINNASIFWSILVEFSEKFIIIFFSEKMKMKTFKEKINT